ncbi:MAG TPA: hypothetical protein PLY36_10750 [Spirochaetota bacterium]|nr:hypothetical protein [Spirochaetota bacterium]
MLAGSFDQRENLQQLDNYIPNILHGSKNVFIKKRYLNTERDYQSYFVINTSKEIVKSHTILYSGTTALRRFYSGIPAFVPAGVDNTKIEEFRNYVAALNIDVITFLSERLNLLKEPDNPMALYIIPELISNAVKSNYVIEKKLSGRIQKIDENLNCMLEVVCLVNRKKPDYIDLIMRNYARFHEDVEKSIEEALNCRWTNRVKLIKEKIHRENCESSEYGLPSINNAIRKFYNGELFYDGYDDSYAEFGAYQFTMRLPKE